MKGVKPACFTPQKYHQEKILFDILLSILKSNVLCWFFIAPLNFTGQLLIGSSKCFLFLSGGAVNLLFGIVAVWLVSWRKTLSSFYEQYCTQPPGELLCVDRRVRRL